MYLLKQLDPRPIKRLEIVSRPYDVLSAAEARELAEGNALSFYHVIKPEIDFPADHNVYATEVYQKGAENFKNLMSQGVMVQG